MATKIWKDAKDSHDALSGVFFFLINYLIKF